MTCDATVPVVRYRHIDGVTTGMDVVWEFHEHPRGTHIRLVHEWDGPRWPLIGGFAARHVILPRFVGHIAPRTLAVTYYDSSTSPCACFADGIAIATYASVGQRSLVIAPEKAPAGAAAVIVIRPRKGGPGFKYTIPMASLPKLKKMNDELDPPGRHRAVMETNGLFEVTAAAE